MATRRVSRLASPWLKFANISAAAWGIAKLLSQLGRDLSGFFFVVLQERVNVLAKRVAASDHISRTWSRASQVGAIDEPSDCLE